MTETRVQKQTFILHPLKGAFWKEASCLLIADLHLGKAAHFRKQGIPVPIEVQDTNWDRLICLLLDFKPSKVIFLGDLFHSLHNSVCDDFLSITERFHSTQFELVIGNHDILQRNYYESLILKIHEQALYLPPFVFTHHPLETIEEEYYNICGHIHPSVRFKGMANQSLKLPCYYFGAKQGILPAFGAFTGTATIFPQRKDQIFVITDDLVIPARN